MQFDYAVSTGHLDKEKYNINIRIMHITLTDKYYF